MSDEGGAIGEAGGNEDGGEGRGWLSSIPENLREHEAIKGAESLSDIYTGFAELSDRSKEGLTIPGEDATDEDRAAFYQRLGRPETSEEYTFTKPELPEDVSYDETVQAAFKELAFEHGLSQEQATNLHDWYWSTVKAGYDEQQKTTENALETLKTEWKGDAFAENTERAVRAFKKFGGEQAQAFIDKTVDGVQLGNHPTFLRVFAEIGKAISDDTMGGSRSHTTDAIVSDEERAKRRFPNTEFRENQ